MVVVIVFVVGGGDTFCSSNEMIQVAFDFAPCDQSIFLCGTDGGVISASNMFVCYDPHWNVSRALRAKTRFFLHSNTMNKRKKKHLKFLRNMNEIQCDFTFIYVRTFERTHKKKTPRNCLFLFRSWTSIVQQNNSTEFQSTVCRGINCTRMPIFTM